MIGRFTEIPRFRVVLPLLDPDEDEESPMEYLEEVSWPPTRITVP
jgi:hypothetical protein